MRRTAVLALVFLVAAFAAGAGRADDHLSPQQMKKMLQRALTYEKTAERAIAARDWKLAHDSAFSAGSALAAIAGSTYDGIDRDELTKAEADTINALVRPAYTSDFKAAKAAQRHDPLGAINALAAAAVAKKRLGAYLDDVVGNRCEVTKEFELFAVPQGYSAAYTDVFPHGVPRGAKNILVRFVDVDNAAPPGQQAFQGQTWKATNRGFTSDGKLVIRIDVSGAGLGAPNAVHKTWRVVVTYDC